MWYLLHFSLYYNRKKDANESTYEEECLIIKCGMMNLGACSFSRFQAIFLLFWALNFPLQRNLVCSQLLLPAASAGIPFPDNLDPQKLFSCPSSSQDGHFVILTSVQLRRSHQPHGKGETAPCKTEALISSNFANLPACLQNKPKPFFTFKVPWYEILSNRIRTAGLSNFHPSLGCFSLCFFKFPF